MSVALTGMRFITGRGNNICIDTRMALVLTWGVDRTDGASQTYVDKVVEDRLVKDLTTRVTDGA